MASVVWTKGATTVTFPKGGRRGPIAPEDTRIVSDKLADGSIVAYDLGLTTPPTLLDYEFPHVDLALLASVQSFRTTTVKHKALTFTLTDNSESPAFTKTVRLVGYQEIPEAYNDPALARYTIKAQLQVEPS